MKRKSHILFLLIFLFINHSLIAKNRISLQTDTIDSVSSSRTDTTIFKFTLLNSEGHLVNDSILKIRIDSLMKLPISYSDSLLYQTNFIYVPLVYYFKEPPKLKAYSLNDLVLVPKLENAFKQPQIFISKETFVAKLRSDLRQYITNNHADLYEITVDDLPAVSSFKERIIGGPKSVGYISVIENNTHPEYEKLRISEIKKKYWRKKASALMQFSQNYISSNWHQGGNSNLALLSILNGQLIFDNLNNIQWENNIEWRAGFNSVEGDTLRNIAANDDLLRYTTKFGVKAFGNWFYSASGEIATQLFDNYKAINSNVFKARLFTPVRVNLGLGMDYKYKKIFSLMVAPVSFKYIYVNDTLNVNPNLFGVVKGNNHLSEIGSSFKAQLSYSPMLNWQVDSRLTFFTNYKKVETDWEIVNNFTLNRYISARLSLNPRYDNTVIEKNGEKARIQFKQLLSIGLSVRLL